MLPRVALEYGHTWCAARTISAACSSSKPGSVTSRPTAIVNERSSAGPKSTRDSMLTSSASSFWRRATALIAPSKHAALADREELLGVRAATLAAELLRRAQLDV